MYNLKKSLGQHFLKDENISKKIIQSLSLAPGDQLLEIGPGAGALTKYLLQIPDIHFKAVEIDEEKVNYLLHHFPAVKEKIITDDILQTAPPFEGDFKVIGNFPYNISSQILFHILEWKSQVTELVGMFQKEVARRIASTSHNKEYGILSVLIQAWFEVTYLFEVSENCFEPPPKVKSAVIKLVQKKSLPDIPDDSQFVCLVKMAFSQRRKKLRNPLQPLFDKDILQENIFDKRAEELSVDDFIALAHKMKRIKKVTSPANQ